MRTPTTAELFGAWEAGLSQPPLQRALTLAALVTPESDRDLTALGIGRRDALLLALRTRTFGARLSGQVACPACSCELELAFDAGAIQALDREPPSDWFLVRYGEFEITARCPTTADLSSLDGSDVTVNTRRVACACILSARRRGAPIKPAALPDAAVNAVSERLSEMDPLGAVSLSTSCPGCGHAWEAPFDIAAFLWTEIHAWGCRLLRDIHALASAYGWRERDILAVSPLRRQAYLDMIGA
jgi:hypothetical protein